MEDDGCFGGALISTHETTDLRSEAVAVANDWERKRIKYLKDKAVTSALTNVVLHSASLSGLSSKCQNSIRSALVSQETKDFQGLSTHTQLNFQGETRRAVVNLLQRDLELTCRSLMRICNAKDTSQLLEQVDGYVSKVSNSKSHQMQTEVKSELARRSTSTRHWRVLRDLIDDHYLASAPESARISSSYLAAKARTLTLKCKSLDQEKKALIYSKDVNLRLERTRRILSQGIRDAKDGIEKLRGEAARYEGVVGEEFEEVVRTYSAVISDIKGKEWAIEGLSKGKV